MSDQPFIVAEVSKNWRNGIEVTPGSGLLAEQFERVILVNAARGYRLRHFQLHRMMTAPGELNETIIAVFDRRDPPADTEAEAILRAIIYASDDCRGHRDCDHSMEPWRRARALLKAREPREPGEDG